MTTRTGPLAPRPSELANELRRISETFEALAAEPMTAEEALQVLAASHNYQRKCEVIKRNILNSLVTSAMPTQFGGDNQRLQRTTNHSSRPGKRRKRKRR